MPTPFIGQIIMFGGNYAPRGWALCDGSLLPIAGNEALFNLIGTTYGGDGQETFGLPDLRSRIPIGDGQGRGLSSYAIGETVGVETVGLNPRQLPPHSHPVYAADRPGSADAPAGNALLSALGGQAESEYQLCAYAPPGDQTQLSAATVGGAGGGQPHSNVQPWAVVTYCIALVGQAPPR
jgi:microcystin-dependent protein